jgi:hypothetical protein
VDQADRHRNELPAPAQDHTQGPQESKVSTPYRKESKVSTTGTRYYGVQSKYPVP